MCYGQVQLGILSSITKNFNTPNLLNDHYPLRLFLSCLLFGWLLVQPLLAQEWTVPMAGNTYRTAPEPGRLPIDGEGALRWKEPSEAYTVFVRLDRPARLRLSLEAAGPAVFDLSVLEQSFTVAVERGAFSSYEFAEIEVPEAGYLPIRLQVRTESEPAGRVRALRIQSDTAELKLDYVQSNQGNMFYWGRRGPSVHLGYPLPAGKQIEYAYSELRVPEGEDPPGSYFMANGFGEGYFGIQVRSATERWVLFSVWSPYHTNNPREIPEGQRVQALAVGEGVVDRSFGGEGSGGQSFLVYPWKAGTTYRFLTQVRPDGAGNTDYTAWFAEKGGEWQLMARFRRPKTDTWYRGFHSFLENFLTSYGHIGREAYHGNQWSATRTGNGMKSPGPVLRPTAPGVSVIAWTTRAAARGRSSSCATAASSASRRRWGVGWRARRTPVDGRRLISTD